MKRFRLVEQFNFQSVFLNNYSHSKTGYKLCLENDHLNTRQSGFQMMTEVPFLPAQNGSLLQTRLTASQFNET
jgi:hypothetical protein